MGIRVVMAVVMRARVVIVVASRVSISSTHVVVRVFVLRVRTSVEFHNALIADLYPVFQKL